MKDEQKAERLIELTYFDYWPSVVECYNSIDWTKCSEETICRAHRYLSAGSNLAKDLVLKGLAIYPESEKLWRLRTIYFFKEDRANNEWLKRNRRKEEYYDKWIALKNGVLLAVGDSVAEICEQVGVPTSDTGILIERGEFRTRKI